MRTGRPPKPTAIKELAGNPGRRPLNRLEPKPRVSLPPAPSWLQGAARKEYRRVGKLLLGLRVMTEADCTALALYAKEYDRYIYANQMLDENGVVMRGALGAYYQSPWLHTANTAYKNLCRMLSEFGLTPSSRSRISAVPEPSETLTLAEQLFSGVTVGND